MKNAFTKSWLFVLMLCLTSFATANDTAGSNDKASDAQVLLQALLDAPQLNAYFHVDVLPARIPLRIVKGDWYRTDLNLMKFGQAVRFVDQAKLQGPCFIIRKLDIKADTATIQFRYPPEGIGGEAVFARKQQTWHLQSITIREQ